MKYEGVFGTVEGTPLTEVEVSELSEGTQVTIIWSGGNGPHHYVIAVRDEDGPRYAVSLHSINDERMRYYNPITFIGAQRFHTRVFRGHIERRKDDCHRG